MGLYFPDTVRPKGGPCPLRQDVPFRGPYCPIYNACRGDACPAIDVGPHGRLIDADANLAVMMRVLDAPLTGHGAIETAMLKACIKMFEEAPTIIPAEEGE